MAAGFEAAARRFERGHNERAWLAWHIAGISRMKKMPKLEAMLVKKAAAQRRQNWREQMMIMDRWMAVRRRAQQMKADTDGR